MYVPHHLHVRQPVVIAMQASSYFGRACYGYGSPVVHPLVTGFGM